MVHGFGGYEKSVGDLGVAESADQIAERRQLPCGQAERILTGALAWTPRDAPAAHRPHLAAQGCRRRSGSEGVEHRQCAQLCIVIAVGE